MIRQFLISQNSQKYQGKTHIKRNECFDMTLADLDIGVYTKLQDKIINQFSIYCQAKKNTNQLLENAKSNIIKWYNQQYHCYLKLQGVKQNKNTLSLIHHVPAYINFVPSVVTIITYSILAFTKKNDRILIFTPVYSTYITLIQSLNRQVVVNSLFFVKNQKSHEENINLANFFINFKQLETQLKNGIKMLIISHPHNPGGRVWNKQEVQYLTKVCKQNDVVIVSDQILSDLCLLNESFYSFAREFPKYSKIIVSNSISKSFNYSSIQGGYALMGDIVVNTRLNSIITQNFNDRIDNLALCAIVHCLSQVGKQWLYIVKQIIMKNYNKLIKFKQQVAPLLKMSKLQAAYLVYVDFSAYFVNQSDLVKLKQKNIWLLLIYKYYYPTKKKTLQTRICIGCQESHFDKFLKALQIIIRQQISLNKKMEINPRL